MDYLKRLANDYSNIATIVDIGKSVEGRELRVIKIGIDPSNRSNKPGIWIDGGIHAREWISPASVEYLVHELVENFELPENKNLIENFYLYILPIMNPDGYASYFLFSRESSPTVYLIT